MTTLTQAEYQQQIAELTTPEAIAAFVSEHVIAPSDIVVAPRKPGRPRKLIGADTSSSESWKHVASSDIEEKVIALYAKGLTTRDIANYLKEHHGVEVSQATISNTTDKVYPLVKEW